MSWIRYDVFALYDTANFFTNDHSRYVEMSYCLQISDTFRRPNLDGNSFSTGFIRYI